MIKNFWYAIYNGKKVKKNEVVAIKRLGLNLALFRDSKGGLHCVTDKCAHRGASLGHGTVKNDCIKCPFHGIEYDSEGKCTLVPSEGINSEKDFSRFNLKHYFIREKQDMVFFWYGDGEPTKEPDTFEVLDDESLQFSERVDHWKVDYSRVIENQLDVSHLPFVHHNTIGRGNKTISNGPKTIWLDENTLQTSANNEVDHGQMPKSGEESVIKSTNLTFKYPNMWLNTISDKLKVFAYFVPIDEENALLCLRFYNKFTGVAPIDSFISVIGKYANGIIQNQDKRVVETQLPKKTEMKLGENLVQADKPIIEYRKRRQELKEENNTKEISE